MGEHDSGRMAAILVSVLFFVISLIFNGLAVPGIPPFTTTTANVSDVFDTPITPTGLTFNIWAVIYTWFIAMITYILTGLCRKNGYGYVYCSPSLLPYGFFVNWCLNLCFNIGWLFVWDQGMMIVALCFLLLVITTNYSMIAFSCHGLHIYGAWLNKYHKVELWLFRVLSSAASVPQETPLGDPEESRHLVSCRHYFLNYFFNVPLVGPMCSSLEVYCLPDDINRSSSSERVQNGIAVYTTWTTLATLINLTIVLIYNANMSPMDAATISLSILAVVLIVWFILENAVLDKHVRYILTIYPVVIWALSGNLVKNYDAASPSRAGIFIAALLALACTLFVVRIVLVIWRHNKQPLYRDVSPEAMSPIDAAENQKKIFS